MFLKRVERAPKRQREGTPPNVPDFHQPPPKRAKIVFPLTDDILTRHLFNKSEPFVSQLEKEVENERVKNLEIAKIKDSEDKPAWEDEHITEIEIDEFPEDDVHRKLLGHFMKNKDLETLNGSQYESCMRQVYTQLHPPPKWWQDLLRKQIEGQAKDNKHLDQLFQSTDSLVSESRQMTFHRQQNLNIFELPSKTSSVVSIEFHPTLNIAQVASSDNVVRIFKIDGNTNPLVQKFFNFKRRKIAGSKFSKDGKAIFVSSDSSSYYKCDLETGLKHEYCIGNDIKAQWKMFVISEDNQYIAFVNENVGMIDLVLLRTNYSVAKFRTNSKIKDITFTADSKYLVAVTSNSKVYVWGLENKVPVNVFADESVEPTRIAVSKRKNYFAVAGFSGVVNVYNYNDLFAHDRDISPVKVLKNVTTSIDTLKFCREGKLLVVGSSRLEDKLRLFEIPSFKCLEDFPNFGKSGKQRNVRCFCADFSQKNEYFAIGLKRRVLLYRIVRK